MASPARDPEERGVAIQTVHDWLNCPDGSKLKARQR
jgi:hypothetical protein